MTHQTPNKLRQGLVSALAMAVALGYLATVLQVQSLSVMTIGLATAADFPCAGHDCGCKTAAQCQTSCCCFPKVAPKPAAKSCCNHDNEQPATLAAFSSCTGAKAIIQAEVKRLTIPRPPTLAKGTCSPATNHYGIPGESLFTPVDPETTSPIPIFS